LHLDLKYHNQNTILIRINLLNKTNKFKLSILPVSQSERKKSLQYNIFSLESANVGILKRVSDKMKLH